MNRQWTHWLVLVAWIVGACDDGIEVRSENPLTLAELPELAYCEVGSEEVFVGHSTFEHIYNLPWNDEKRTITIHYWYPTSEPIGEHPTYLGLWPDRLSRDEAPYLFDGQRCKVPLLVNSHGSQGYGGNITLVTSQLVQQGWVVAAPDHTDNTLTDHVEGQKDFMGKRVSDLVQIMDVANSFPNLYGQPDSTRVAVSGHSVGGWAAWYLSGAPFDMDVIDSQCTDCSAEARSFYENWRGDPRVAGVVPKDGAPLFHRVTATTFEDKRVPVLAMTTEAQYPRVKAILDTQVTDITVLNFIGSCHESFTSTQDTCPGPNGLEKEEGLRAVRAYFYAFLRKHVTRQPLPDDAAILDGSQKVADFVTFESQ